MAEVISILTSRPLAPICIDTTGEEPLASEHFASPTNTPNVSSGMFSQDNNYAANDGVTFIVLVPDSVES